MPVTFLVLLLFIQIHSVELVCIVRCTTYSTILLYLLPEHPRHSHVGCHITNIQYNPMSYYDDEYLGRQITTCLPNPRSAMVSY
ncbi:hypothetical protein F4811DRAFT_516290 [Daldinia bambusicola]|nr:hypothetical protein F4811DRAFT_516290 [Daldinia bambusicola]